MTTHSQTEQPGAFRQVLQSGAHPLHADVAPALGGADSAPGPHDYFDAALTAYNAVAQCPIHKLMTTSTVDIVTEPLEA